MDKTTVNGILLTTPTLSYANGMEGDSSFQFAVVKFFIQTEHGDIYPCICFENQAYYLKEKKYHKNSHIRVSGIFKSYKYVDGNGTKHFTQILMLVSVMDQKMEDVSLLEKKYMLMKKQKYQLIDMNGMEYVERIS